MIDFFITQIFLLKDLYWAGTLLIADDIFLKQYKGSHYQVLPFLFPFNLKEFTLFLKK